MRWARYYIRKLFHNSSGNKPTHPPGGFLRNKPVGTFHFPTGTKGENIHQHPIKINPLKKHEYPKFKPFKAYPKGR